MSINQEVVARADRVADEVLADFISRAGTQSGGVLSSVAGGGKSYFVSRAAGRARKERMRVAVCAPTNDQAIGLVERIATMNPGERVTFVPAREVELPPWIRAMPNVDEARPARTAAGANLIVGTFDKLGDAFDRGDLTPVDGLLADESYQADSTRYYKVAGLAPTHLLVGDGGQIDPFSTAESADRWRGLEEDPLRTAVAVLRRNHPETALRFFPITRRLDGRAMPVVRAFYPPEQDFAPAVLPGVRGLRFQPSIASSGRLRRIDRTLELAAEKGWGHIELPEAAVLTADPEATELIVDILRRLRDRGPRVRCERDTRWQALPANRIAVGVSHNDQKDLLKLALDAAGLGDVVVNTANKLQGLEFDLVVCWHPLAGLPDADEFHLDPGRLCVLMTRHRHACIVVGREGDRQLLDGIPPATPAYLGCDDDRTLDGWATHQAVFAALEGLRVGLL